MSEGVSFTFLTLLTSYPRQPMLKRFRSKPPQGSRLLRDITTFSAATGSPSPIIELSSFANQLWQDQSRAPIVVALYRTHRCPRLSQARISSNGDFTGYCKTGPWASNINYVLNCIVVYSTTGTTTADALNNIQHALRFANQDVAQAGNATNKLSLVFI
ncbi:hypothetical protein YC2023_031552 [Brassica napus]